MTNKRHSIKKAHVGRPVDFRNGLGQIVNGKITKVAHSIATIEFYMPDNFYAEPYTTYIPTNSPMILEVY